MSIPSNGITPEVIREMMPPYHLSQDLLEGTLSALPPPPPDATPAWRETRATRLIAEIATLMPATAGQARMAAQVLVLRELADNLARQVYAPEVSVAEMYRMSRGAGELARSATMLGRELTRCQQTPAPFFGTVVADGVDVAALVAAWGSKAPRKAAAGAKHGQTAALRGEAASRGEAAAGETAAGETAEDGAPVPLADRPDEAPALADPEPVAALMPVSLSADGASAEVRAQPDRSLEVAARGGRDAGAAPEWEVARLDEGPGWTLEVVRPRTGGEVGIGAASGAGGS